MDRASRQTITGVVVSDRMDRTVVIRVETLKKHPRYKKYIRRRKKYKAHDENNECSLGDVVRAMSTRPLSKGKHWRVAEVVEKHEVSTLEVAEAEELVMKKQALPPKKEEPAVEAVGEAAAVADAEVAAPEEEAPPEPVEEQPEEGMKEEEAEAAESEEEEEAGEEEDAEEPEKQEEDEENTAEKKIDDTGTDKTESS